MHKILVSDKLGQAGLDLLEATENVSYEMRTGLSKDELIAIMPEYDGLIIRSGTRPDADIIGAGTNLKVIGRAGIGVDNIDIPGTAMNSVLFPSCGFDGPTQLIYDPYPPKFLMNNGQQNLEITGSPEITGANAGDFSILSFPTQTLFLPF